MVGVILAGLPLPAALASEPVLEYQRMNDVIPCRVAARPLAAISDSSWH